MSTGPFFLKVWGFFLSMFFLLSIHSKNCQAGRSETWLPVTKCDLCGTAGSSRSEVLPSMPAAALAPGCVQGFGWDWGGGCAGDHWEAAPEEVWDSKEAGKQIQAKLRLCQLLAMEMLLMGGYQLPTGVSPPSCPWLPRELIVIPRGAATEAAQS